MSGTIVFFYVLYCILFLIGIIFKFLLGAEFMLLFGFLSLVFFVFLVSFEMADSENVNKGIKVLSIILIWTIPFVTLVPVFWWGWYIDTFHFLGINLASLLTVSIPVIAGAVYLTVGRRVFIPKVSAIDKIEFDSI
jgi:hypothetical protein